MNKSMLHFVAIIYLLAVTFAISKEEKRKPDTTDPMSSSTFSGLKFRSLGPALASGRISDFAVNPNNNNIFYVAVACGNVWKTTNFGTTFSPIFDAHGSYSIGCLALDPNNPHIIWIGTGENNSQRSVGYGDGVYKSEDGGKSFKNMGLKNSEHIGKIIIHPQNSNLIYVAAQGPLWGPGGDRGLYKSTDCGNTWEKSLYISENTGVSDLAIDPRNPDIIYATAYQRRRHVWTLINGGPESAIYKTTDGGKNWNKLSNGLPSGDVGRIGIAISPANPDIIYALIEASDDKGGFFRSTDRGASWEKRNPIKTTSAQYYQEIFCDPINPDVVYSVDTYTQYTEDGGKTFKRLSTKNRHVDDHALWIDPKNTSHMLIGGDGGIYESWDKGEQWRFFDNLPVTQFYRIGIDDAEPFYNVYGGTQDNATIGGPSRTLNKMGILNQDWVFTKEGDGFQSRIDPENPNIVYSQSQYGNLVRFDKQSGERTDIMPQEEPGEELRWNWDSPLIISPHSTTRLYFAANKLFRSDDRGNSWRKVSGDLSRQLNRDSLKVMDKLWSPEAVAKNASTSYYGNIVSLVESSIKENLIYVGTDDGLIQVTEDGGNNWRTVSTFPSIPELSYVSDIFASQHNENVVYASFDNHKMADFKPYILKSTDKGKSWKTISSNLPDRGTVNSIYEDYKNPDLLFAGTEFGFFFTNDGGQKWVQLKGGLPTIAIKDIEIQKREDDITLASFGRGFYILDYLAPLRELNKEILNKEAHIFSIKDALMYHENTAIARNDFGDNFYTAENPPFGATFTYYLKDSYKTKKEIRKEYEKEREKKGQGITYPTFEQLRQEDLEEKPFLIFDISDSEGNLVRRLTAAPQKGINRITWDLRYYDMTPFGEKEEFNKKAGYPVMPGKYTVTMFKSIDGKITKITEPVAFNAKLLDNVTLPARDRQQLVSFQRKIQKLQRAYYGTAEFMKELKTKIEKIKNAVLITPAASKQLIEETRAIELEYKEIEKKMFGDESLSKRNVNQTPPINDRLDRVSWYLWATSSSPTQAQQDAYNIVCDEFAEVYEKLKKLLDVKITEVENQMEKYQAPLTPGRLPVWKKE